MRFKRLSVLFALMLMFCTFFSSFAFAESNIKPNLVALGDSITFGLNLEDPSTQAFPHLIGNGTFNVTNLSDSGLTSDGLKDKVKDPANAPAIQQADVFTLYIGGNDLLVGTGIKQILESPTPVDITPELLQQISQAALVASNKLASNLTEIITAIRMQNTDAPIILYNLYNPIGDSKDNPYIAAIHGVGEQLINGGNGIPGVNALFAQAANTAPGTYLIDAYSAFDGHQADFILPRDIHPTVEGHKKLADLANGLLSLQVPAEIKIDLTPSTTETTKEPVTITVTTTAKKVLAMQWLDGEKTIADFATAGTDITNNKFQVTENGIYTVYVRDSKGTKAVGTIKIDNIKVEDPTPIPGDTGNNPDPNPGDTSTDPGDSGSDPGSKGDNGDNPAPNPTETDSPAPTTDNQNTDTSNELPVTASTTYNYMAAGLGLILAGFAVMQIQQYRRKEKI